MRHLFHTITTVTLLTAACSGAGFADEQDSAPPDSPAGLAAQAVAQRTGVTAKQLVVLSEQAVDFGDSSLDCPQPGMSYLQVITPGHKVMIEYRGQIYDVRVAGGRAIICEQQRD